MSTTKITSIVTKRKNRTSPRLTTAIYPAVTQPKDESNVADTTIAILVLSTVTVIIVIGCILSYAIYRYRKANGRDPILEEIRLTSDEHTNQEQGLNIVQPPEGYDILKMIRRINTSESNTIQIIPTEEDKTIAFDKMYVSVSFVDDYRAQRDQKEEIKELNLHEIFHAQKYNEGKETTVRFVFMLGDAGYGKTVQCKHITMSWCKAWGEAYLGSDSNSQLNDLEMTLKEYHFLFFVRMRDVGDKYLNLIDIILNVYSHCHQSKDCRSDVQNILEGRENKCLILLDGLDEWNISDNKKKRLPNGIPNLEGILNSTILITMRSWKFMEVKGIFRKELDRVVRLHGLDAKGLKGLMTNMLCNYYKIDTDTEDFQDEYTKLEKEVQNTSEQLRSMMKIPLLAVFCILRWKEDMNSIRSITTLYLSIVEALIKRSLKKGDIQGTQNGAAQSSHSTTIKRYPYMNERISDLKQLGNVALETLDSGYLFSADHAKNYIDEATLKCFLKIGILFKEQSQESFQSDNVKISCLHKTIHEFLASLYLNESKTVFENYLDSYIQTIGKAFDHSMVLIFLSGLSPAIGCKISNHMVMLSNKDDEICRFREYFASESYRKVFWFFDLQMKCYREVNVSNAMDNTLNTQKLPFLFSDIILHGRDTDKQTVRETADVLIHHAGDILSLQMKLIPDDKEEGITNEELQTFLRTSKIKSLNIDGYICGNCRLFDKLSECLPGLRTLGLHNIAFKGDNLTEALRNNGTKENIEALGIFYVGTETDLKVPFRYQFSSEKKVPSDRTGNERKCTMPSSPEISGIVCDRQGIGYSLKDILGVLPTYKKLKTFHVSYMDSPDDRDMLLTVIPQIKTLRHFGYQGSLVHPRWNKAYDASVITMILKKQNLTQIFLCDIVFDEQTFNFENMSDLVEINLQDINLSSVSWDVFSRSIWKIPNKRNIKRIVFMDTNVTFEIQNELQNTFPWIKVDVDESSVMEVIFPTVQSSKQDTNL